MATDFSEFLPENQPVRSFKSTPAAAMVAATIAGGIGCLGGIKLWVIVGTTIAIACAVTGLVVAGLILYFFAQSIRVNQTETGLSFEQGKKRWTIRFEDLIGFRSKWTDHYSNGIYCNTKMKFTFRSLNSDKPTVFDNSAIADSDLYKELEAFQQDIAEAVSVSMLKALQQDGFVQWTPRLTLLPDAIEFRKRASVEAIRFPFDDIRHYEIDRGLLKVAVFGDQRPRFTESISCENFFPGLRVFRQLNAWNEQSQTEAQELVEV